MAKTNNTKQAAWIAIGSLFSFGFGIVSSMILSRYFEKGDYGTYKQVLYVYHTLLTVFTLGLPKAYSYFLPRAEKDQAKSLIRKLTNLFFLLGGVFSFILFAGAGLIAEGMNNKNLIEALRIFSVVPILLMPTMGLEGILATYKRTKFMAIYTICTRTMMLLCVALPVMFFNVGYIGAIIGFVVSSFFSCLIALYFKYMPVREYGNESSTVTYREIFQFSLPLLLASLWGMVINSTDQFFISRYFGNEVFAEFSNGSMELPFVGMIIGACSAVLSPIFSRLSNNQDDFKKEIFPLWISVFEKTAKLIYPIVVYCLVFADIVMVLLYGSQYEVSANYFRLKLLANFFTMITYAPLIINTGHVKLYRNVHMYGAIVLITLEYMSIIAFNNPLVIMVVSVSCRIGRILCMLYFAANIFRLKMYELFPLRLVSKILFPSLLILIFLREALMYSDCLRSNPILIFVLSGIVYLCIYAIYCRMANIDYIQIIKPLLKKR